MKSSAGLEHLRKVAAALSLLGLMGSTGLSAEVPERFAAYLDRSYYTTEREAVVVCEVESPGASLALTVRDAQGKALAASAVRGRTTRLAVPCAALPSGAYALTVEAGAPGAASPMTRSLELIKREPKPGLEWKVDQVNRVLLHDGEPFFPFGMIMYGMVAPRDEAAFNEVAALGCNTVVRWYVGADPATATAYHELAAKYHLYVVDPVDRFAKENLIKAKLQPDFDNRVEANLDRIFPAINTLKESRNLAAYYGLDEPTKGQVKSGRMLYHKERELDGYHPAMVLYSSEIPEGDQYIDWCDILGTDPYWTPAGAGVRGSIQWMSKIVTATRERGASGRKVTWILPMAESWSGISKRPLLPREQFAQTYLALIHGAKGLIYFRYPFAHQGGADTLAEVGRQLAVLGPIAVTPDIQQTIRYTPEPFAPEQDRFPDVQVALRRNPAGGYVLLAANTRAFPVDAKYRVSLLPASGTVRNLFNESRYAVTDGTFGERLECFETRAYAFPGGALNEPIDLAVECTPHPEQTDPIYGAPGLPISGRLGKKNILRNPGFEEAALSDWPDYYLFSPDGPRLGVPGARTLRSLDPTGPFEGKVCLKLEPAANGSAAQVYQGCVPVLQAPQTYTLSAYMRAERAGVKVKFLGFGWRVPTPTFGYREFTLTTKWERYSETGTLPPKLAKAHSVGVEVVGHQDGAVFIDALQLEQGDQATPYEP